MSKFIFSKDQNKIKKVKNTLKASFLVDRSKNLKKLNLNNDRLIQFKKCLNSNAISVRLLNGRIDAQKKYSINSTPTIVINEKKLDKNANFKNIKKKIDKLI